MDKTTFNTHTKGHYLNDNEQRHQLFPHIKQVLKHPDEVWLYDYAENIHNNTFKTNYVKFYKDKTIIIRTDIQKGKNYLNIDTWFDMKGQEQDSRKGLLIKKKKGY